jgi:site-specific recombinase XerD
MSESLQQTLQDHLNSHQHKLVFSDINGAVLSENHMRWMFNKDVRAAGIKKIRFHDIRHTYASHFVMKGGSLYDLMGILGHANIETTMRYAHLSPDHLRSKASIVTFASDAQTAKAPNIFQISEERQKRIRIVKPHKIEVQSL